jgi:hypothetical protein
MNDRVRVPRRVRSPIILLTLGLRILNTPTMIDANSVCLRQDLLATIVYIEWKHTYRCSAFCKLFIFKDDFEKLNKRVLKGYADHRYLG